MTMCGADAEYAILNESVAERKMLFFISVAIEETFKKHQGSLHSQDVGERTVSENSLARLPSKRAAKSCTAAVWVAGDTVERT